MISNQTGLIECLGGIHGNAGRVAKTAVGFDLHTGGREWRCWLARTRGVLDGANEILGIDEFFEEGFDFFFAVESFV